jgi:hypothetical protein
MDDGGVATINSGYLFLRNILVRREGPENASRQWSIDFLAVGEKAVPTGMGDLFHQPFGA